MNTKNKRDEKNQRQKTRQEQDPKKRGQNNHMLQSDLKYQEHEHPETRMTR